MKGSLVLQEFQLRKMVSSGTPNSFTLEGANSRWWDLRTLGMTAEMDLGAPISSMELAHGGGTLSVTSGSKVHFLDILRYVSSCSPVFKGLVSVAKRDGQGIRKREGQRI
jgi:hypothetical protein